MLLFLNNRRNLNVAIKRTEPLTFDDNSDMTAARLFLSHMSFLRPINYDELFAVQKFHDPDHKFNYLQNFSVLDKTRE